ncbi:MAG: tautomerase family protein [Christensenellaceae bacterium]|nr:tautomerase family protein [Christensenellaceae bacterium]
MPHIDITMFPGRDDKVKSELAKKVRLFIADELSIDKSVVSVSVKDIEKEKWMEHIKTFSEDTMYEKPEYK